MLVYSQNVNVQYVCLCVFLVYVQHVYGGYEYMFICLQRTGTYICTRVCTDELVGIYVYAIYMHMLHIA